MTTIVRYELSPDLRVRYGIDDVAVPVRKERAWEIFQGSTVHLDKLVAEVDLVVGDDPELSLIYGRFLGRMARTVAMAKGLEGDFVTALILCEIGLKHAPGSVRLRTMKATALQVLGHPWEAFLEYRRACWNPRFDRSPLTYVMAARAALAVGERAAALEFLKQCPAGYLADPGFRDLVEAAGGVVDEPLACTNCGCVQDHDNDFCPKCGTRVKRP